jgi:hypothetical protein
MQRAILYALYTISIVALNKHNLFCYIFPLLNGAESNHARCAWVGLLVSMGNAHAASNSYVESDQFPTRIDNGDESNVVGKYIHIVRRRNSNGDFELDCPM